ncbi:hypothetical protein BS78_10G234200 [Paspalum vaginatum]|nr:hypothetical protein BS78_10G234200 [Paspalum vaginatum]
MGRSTGHGTTTLMAAAALRLLLVMSLAAACMSTKSYRERSEEEIRRMLAECKAKYERTYGSVGEEERRYAIFKETLRSIDQHNATFDAGVELSRQGINFFADRTDEDYPPWWPGFRPDLDLERGETELQVPASGNVDWRKKKGSLAKAKQISR